jgi:hypothetical protein
MKYLFFFFLLLCLVLTLSSCGNIFIRGALPAGSSTVSGSISVVQLSAVIGENGTTVQVTFVTFFQSGIFAQRCLGKDEVDLGSLCVEFCGASAETRA